VRNDFFGQHALLRIVHCFDRIQNIQPLAVFRRRALQGLHIFREARTAVAHAWVQKVIANARIGTNPLAHMFNVRAEFFRQIGEFIHKRNACCQHCVGCIFGQLRRAHIHKENTIMITHKRRVEALHQFTTDFILHANHNAIRAHEIFHGRAFFQEFRIRYHAEINIGTARGQFISQSRAHLIGSSHRHSGFIHHHFEFIHIAADIARRSSDIFQIRRAIFIGRRTHRNKLDQAMRHRFFNVSGKTQTAFGHIALHHFFQTRLVNRNTAVF